ncbi:MAG: DIP1984 family protein [Planctomycetia bacterium]|nr:DIP1984 family protein [Planctomycetia bacterium]
MKVAEALILKSDLRKRIEQIRDRLVKNAKVQEGDAPGEKPEDLLMELDRLLTDYESLIRRITAANQTAAAGSGTLADLIVQKKLLTIKQNYYEKMSIRAGYEKSLFGGWKQSSPAKLYAELERIKEEVHKLDTAIQQLNWQIELQ